MGEKSKGNEEPGRIVNRRIGRQQRFCHAKNELIKFPVRIHTEPRENYP